MRHTIYLILLSFCWCLAANAQDQAPEKKFAYWGNPDLYLVTQADEMLSLINETLNEFPPTTEKCTARKSALYNLDAILHNTAFDKSDILQQYIKTRILSVVEDLDKPLTENLKIYKIYNDGFLLRTKSLTVAVDLDGRQGQIVNDSLMNLLVNRSDILFISHNHSDHGDVNVVNMFQAQGKQVYAPDEFWPENEKINHIWFDKGKDLTMKVRNQKLKVRVYPGHQDKLHNNIHVFTLPEGYTVAHLGDQYLEEDMEWIQHIYKEVKNLDVLIVDCWILKLQEVIASFDPKLVVTAHENEMFHTIDHREAFWLTYYKMQPVTKPYLIMSWGEWYEYK